MLKVMASSLYIGHYFVVKEVVEQLFYVIVTILKVFEKQEIIVIFFYGILSLLSKILNYTCYTSF